MFYIFLNRILDRSVILSYFEWENKVHHYFHFIIIIGVRWIFRYTKNIYSEDGKYDEYNAPKVERNHMIKEFFNIGDYKDLW